MPAARAVGLLGAVALDALLGDPARFHPVAGFGRAALALERVAYRPSRAAGATYTIILVVAPALAARRVGGGRGRAVALAACGWAALGGRSLRRTAARMADLIDAGELEAARALARSLVARRTATLDGAELTRATLESLAENTADAEAGTLLWGAVAGAPGAVAHRAANTLDAMVGYRSERYAQFGWAAARLDDVLGWPAARACAGATVVAAVLCGEDARGAVRAWRRDGARHPSPNAGRVEAAFAGALGVTLGGRNDYDGTVEDRPRLGDGPPPDTAALRRAIRLSATTSAVLALGAAGVAAWR
ncbi:MAG TPA: adenosylcobinamide-phosphate synthase CbiB [Baekduia sp.]|uniref:adenosylcobinamide-phosphate synthase CbiB n=1 Tax=Baekduia sp. TaxID=2600305 RepID=UPI002D77F3CD|nr:adenosylcobinamide-phosphate synthase CbiB [Baekduia sp.]HET6505676.1 adenosylcobinamide-phosphate synthase CbiB [Baekduia sp.]